MTGADRIRWNPPAGWHESRDGSLSCPHRDLSVCPDCLAAAPECVPTFGACFWIATPEARADLAAMVDR